MTGRRITVAEHMLTAQAAKPSVRLTHTDPYCATCGRPADAHNVSGRCPEPAAGMFATYEPVSAS